MYKIDPDVQSEIYHKGFLAGSNHSTSSKETKEALKVLTATIEETKELSFQIKEISKDNKKEINYIRVQTTRTNGRVTVLEEKEVKEQIELATWKSSIKTWIIALGVFIPTIISLVIYIFNLKT